MSELTSALKTGDSVEAGDRPHHERPYPTDQLKNRGTRYNIRTAIGRYWDNGYAVIDASELTETLRHSRDPERDNSSARLGFGVTLRSRLCPTETCEEKIDMDGSEHVLNKCGEEHLGPEQAKQIDVMKCWDCFRPFQFKPVYKKGKEVGRIACCPHCDK